jgi:hypothetical protein
MKLYLAGPMRGIAEFNFPAFMKAAEELREQGHDVFNPAERDKKEHGDFEKGNEKGDEAVAAQQGFSLREALAADMEYIAKYAEGIALLPGWTHSSGAKAERALADALRLEIIYLPGAEPKSTEMDPNGLAANQPGAKLDAGKSPVYRGVIAYFPRAIKAIGQLSSDGAENYSWDGWRRVDNGVARYSDAMGRHIVDEAIEGPWDLKALNRPKHPYHALHKTAVAWNALAALELYLEAQEKA